MFDYNNIKQLKKYSVDLEFHKSWFEVKRENKVRLTALVKEQCNVDFDCDSLFDVQVKRIHEHKRQLLNILHVVHLYDRSKRGDTDNWTSRCGLIGGKTAPGYRIAKSIIKLINNISDVINNDREVDGRLMLAFIPNYGVSKMEVICPGTDLSEQISTAGKEASGNDNMKFMMNGAVTIGTYDGAHIEILDAVGEDNFFLFGLKADGVERQRVNYNPKAIVETDADLNRVMHLLTCGHFNSFECVIFDDIINSLMNHHDPWLTLADFRSYIDAQSLVSKAYQDREKWITMSINNTACSDYFSTDRTMREYNDDIWRLNS